MVIPHREAQVQRFDTIKGASPMTDAWISKCGGVESTKRENACVVSERVGGIWKANFQASIERVGPKDTTRTKRCL